MPGNETKNYDLVIEFAEQAYRDVLGTLFDSDGFLCSLLDKLEDNIPGFPHIPCGAFTLDVLFDRPTDVSLPVGTRDTLDIRVSLGEGGSIGSLRIVAGVDVNPTTVAGVQMDIVRINLADKTYYASVNISGFPDPGGVLSGIFSAILRDIGFIPLLPVPVNRAATSPTEIYSADVRIIDDALPEDRDASAVLLTFGGGVAGNKSAFTRSFIPAGETGGIAVDFDWLCRIIRPRLASALGIPEDAFSPPCRLNRTVRIDEDEEVDLTRLELTLVNGFIQVTAAVRKSGTGYTATGTVRGRIRIAVTGGNLVIQSEVDDPDIDIDLDWWVWLAASVIGALIGGIIGGVIGAIIGAILGPLITWLATEIIEGLIENIASRIIDAIRSLNFQVPAVGLNLVFQEVFIDDITIGCRVEVQDTSPVRAEGVMMVKNGERFDLDNGTVGGETLSGADMVWDGSELNRRLRTLCDVGLARTGSRSLTGFSRYKMYSLPYETPNRIPLDELAVILPYPDWLLKLLGLEKYQERGFVYGVRTNEERYSLLQVIEVKDDSVSIRYRTYEMILPKIEILGSFSYEETTPGPTDGIITPDLLVGIERVHTEDSKAIPCPPTTTQPLGGLAMPRPVAAKPSPEDVCEARKAGPKRLAKYFKPGVISRAKIGRFQAWTQGMRHPVTTEWLINKNRLEEEEGDIMVDGLKLSYSIEEDRITFTPKTEVNASFELGATAKDKEGTIISASRCIEFVSDKPTSQRVTPNWAAYREEYRNKFGIVQVVG